MHPDVATQNWANNVTFSASAFHHPRSVPELQQLVSASSRLRVLGTGHSFSRIADTTGDLVTVAGLPTSIVVDADRRSVRVSAGTRYGELGTVLQQSGWALANTGSLPHISIAGASATGTHGSGSGIGNLSTLVSAIEVVTADGDIIQLSRDRNNDEFNGMVLALGCLGVMTSLTLDIVPTFLIQQDIYDDVPHDDLVAAFDEISSGAYSVSAFSTWSRPRTQHVWRKSVAATSDPVAAVALLGALPAAENRSPLGPGWPADNVTTQGAPGPWNERLPHFRIDFTPSFGEELQSEFMLARSDMAAAMHALDDIADRIAAVLQVTELRTVAADELWLSPSYQRDTVCFHFTWIHDIGAVTMVLREIEERLAPFGARPHWGKVFVSEPAAVRPLYPRLADFRALADRFDPTGKFRNRMVEEYVFADR